MIGAYDVVNSQWLWQEVPASYGEGMIEHVTASETYAVHEDW